MRQKGDTVIHELALNNNPALLQDFIRSGCRIFNISTFDGATALHRAAESNSVECARILVEQNADLDAEDIKGWTPFHVAASFKNFEVGRYLARNGAKKSCRNNCGKCRILYRAIQAVNKQSRAKAERIRRERVQEEQKIKEEEEREPQSFNDFLDQMKKEMGGPFCNKEDNKKLKKIIKKNKEKIPSEAIDEELMQLSQDQTSNFLMEQPIKQDSPKEEVPKKKKKKRSKKKNK